MNVKVHDNVQVISGNDAGVQGRVLTVDHKSGRVVVEGVNRVYKHMRKSQKNPQGGRLSKEMPIDVSNVMVICERCGKAARMGLRYGKDGGKERFCKKCGAGVSDVAPPRAAYSAKR